MMSITYSQKYTLRQSKLPKHQGRNHQLVQAFHLSDIVLAEMLGVEPRSSKFVTGSSTYLSLCFLNWSCITHKARNTSSVDWVQWRTFTRFFQGCTFVSLQLLKVRNLP